MSRTFGTFAYLIVAFAVIAAGVYALRAYAAEISNVTITEITENSATIQWKTDTNTDATINYGLDENHGIVRYPVFDRTEHTLTIPNLDPSTTYHFRAVSSDVEGNKHATGGFVFTTKSVASTEATEQIGDTDQKALAEEIISELRQVTDPQAIIAIAEEVKSVAGDIIKPPAIIGAPNVIIEGETVTILWKTDRESNSVVYLVPEDEYRAGSNDPYTLTQGDPDERVKEHRVRLIGLEPATVYHYKVSSTDSLGLTGETADDTFRTKAKLPEFSSIQVSRIQETSAVVGWTTPGVLAKGTVEYTNTRTNVTRSAGDPIYSESHAVQLTGLEFGTRYSAVITSTNEAGDTVNSDPFTFVTVRDVVAPEISKVNNESTLYPGEDLKIQTIIAWETDEPSYCQVFYTQGLSAAGEEGESLQREINPTETHTQVIVGFAPATVYKFWMECADEANNSSRSEDFVLITPIKEKNIIDIILENFEGTFGWVKNITG